MVVVQDVENSQLLSPHSGERDLAFMISHKIIDHTVGRQSKIDPVLSQGTLTILEFNRVLIGY